MASKTSSRKKSSARSKKILRYGCPKSGSPYCLKEIVKKIMRERAFAKFIAEQLCKAHGGDEEAIECVDSYFKPTDAELAAICIPESKRRALFMCTDHHFHLLIDVLAHDVGGGRKS
jgi:hypothetical protein